MTTGAPPLTLLYVPADRPERIEKALASEADAVILDLEDAVAPASKEGARENVRRVLVEPRRKPVIVRVNDIRTPWARADVEAAAAGGAGAIRVPKVEGPADVARVVAWLGGAATEVQALIESARGVEAAYEIATAGVAAIGLGEADLRSDLGVTDEDGLLWSRSRIVVAARAASLPPPAMSVYPQLDDDAGLAASCLRGRALGFLGRAAIHPRQLAVIARTFTPTAEEVRAAQQVLDALVPEGSPAVARLAGGRFVDRAMIEAARRVVALGARSGMRPDKSS